MTTTIARWLGVSLVAAVGAAGCAAHHHPSPRLSTAETGLRQAEASGAAQYDALDLRLAREKLELARRALDQEDVDRARRLSDEALVDAQVAQAKTNSEKARRNAEEVRKSIEALRGEATRPLEER